MSDGAGTVDEYGALLDEMIALIKHQTRGQWGEIGARRFLKLFDQLRPEHQAVMLEDEIAARAAAKEDEHG